MKYKKIIQELKESQDPNVLVFLNDVGNIRRLSRKQQKDILARLHEPGITDILVKSFIPTIVRIAYANSRLTSSLSFLDLVNEGVIGIYKCMNTHKNDGKLSNRNIRATIINAIKKQVCKKECPFTVCRFNENDPRLYQDISRMWGSYNKKVKLPEPVVDKFKWVRNDYGIKVKRCCASCIHKDLTRAVSKRYCKMNGEYIEPLHVCDSWEMNEQMKMAGLVR